MVGSLRQLLTTKLFQENVENRLFIILNYCLSMSVYTYQFTFYNVLVNALV